MREYVEKVFCSDYGYDHFLLVTHKECGTCLPISELFTECEDKQKIRDARHKVGSAEVEGKILKCTACNREVSTRDVYDCVMTVSDPGLCFDLFSVIHLVYVLLVIMKKIFFRHTKNGVLILTTWLQEI
jgi:hypothetical protein